MSTFSTGFLGVCFDCVICISNRGKTNFTVSIRIISPFHVDVHASYVLDSVSVGFILRLCLDAPSEFTHGIDGVFHLTLDKWHSVLVYSHEFHVRFAWLSRSNRHTIAAFTLCTPYASICGRFCMTGQIPPGVKLGFCPLSSSRSRIVVLYTFSSSSPWKMWFQVSRLFHVGGFTNLRHVGCLFFFHQNGRAPEHVLA